MSATGGLVHILIHADACSHTEAVQIHSAIFVGKVSRHGADLLRDALMAEVRGDLLEHYVVQREPNTHLVHEGDELVQESILVSELVNE